MSGNLFNDPRNIAMYLYQTLAEKETIFVLLRRQRQNKMTWSFWDNPVMPDKPPPTDMPIL